MLMNAQGSSSATQSVGEGSKRLRIVHISDTHEKHHKFTHTIPDGDVLVHSGDFMKRRSEGGESLREFMEDFNEWYGSFPHRHKVLVAGNSEICFNRLSHKQIQKMLPSCHYLQDSEVTIEGLKFYGSPWTSSRGMGFSGDEKTRAKMWKKIPKDTDVLVTHMPPLGIFDLAHSSRSGRGVCEMCKEDHGGYRHWGDPMLLERVATKVTPLAHLYGHVHDEVGVRVTEQGILFSNAALDIYGKPNSFEVLYD